MVFSVGKSIEDKTWFIYRLNESKGASETWNDLRNNSIQVVVTWSLEEMEKGQVLTSCCHNHNPTILCQWSHIFTSGDRCEDKGSGRGGWGREEGCLGEVGRWQARWEWQRQWGWCRVIGRMAKTSLTDKAYWLHLLIFVESRVPGQHSTNQGNDPNIEGRSTSRIHDGTCQIGHRCDKSRAVRK